MARKNKSKTGGSPNRPRFWGKHAVAAALDNPERKVIRAWTTHDAAKYMNFDPGLPVTFADVADLGRLVPNDAPHQGVVIEVAPLEDIWLADLLAEAPEKAVLLVLDQVTDPHNVGAILRSAAAFGAIGIVTQDRHSPIEGGVLAKAASGALERVPWARVVNLARALEEIAEAGFWRIGLAGDATSELKDALGPQRVALVLGAEGPGMRHNVRDHCDAVAKLPISAAFDTFKLSTASVIGNFATASQCSRTLWRMPGPSAPSTNATRCGPSASFRSLVASPASPIRQKPASAISSSARARLTTRAHGTRSNAPDAALASTPPSIGEWRSWVTIPIAPKAAAERRIAPTLCGSVT